MNTKAFYKLTYGLYIASSSYEGKDSGCIVNTLSQVTSSPAKLSVTINKDNFTAKTIEKSKKFAAVALLQDVSMDIIAEFGFKSSENTDKFSGFTVERDTAGMPYITDSVAARYSCDVIAQVDLGSHIMFIGEVKEAEVVGEGEVLTYTYYQTVKKGGTPKNAPSYKEDESKGEKGYKCSVCGYHLESDTIPEGFVCPWCKQGADKLVKL